MTTRVSPSERIRAEIEEVARAAVRLVFQIALEAVVTEFLGRDRYTRDQPRRLAERR
jgi:hypothetical protein